MLEQIEIEKNADPRMEAHKNNWMELTRGKFTTSQIHRLMADPRNKAGKGTGALSEGAQNYVFEKVSETLAIKFADFCSSPSLAQQHGIDYEPEARKLFERTFNKKVNPYVYYLYGPHAGGAPDGEVEGESAIIEIKCPFNGGNHVGNILQKPGVAISNEYQIQMQANMLFGKVQKCYFISYDPRMPENVALKVIVVEADRIMQGRILQKLEKAIDLKEWALEYLMSS